MQRPRPKIALPRGRHTGGRRSLAPFPHPSTSPSEFRRCPICAKLDKRGNRKEACRGSPFRPCQAPPLDLCLFLFFCHLPFGIECHTPIQPHPQAFQTNTHAQVATNASAVSPYHSILGYTFESGLRLLTYTITVIRQPGSPKHAGNLWLNSSGLPPVIGPVGRRSVDAERCSLAMQRSLISSMLTGPGLSIMMHQKEGNV
ncbi:hypothetical protein CDEST_06710 [Colletotrichum destructivum]|uniref:Uncharacterized protein n=1 Tax=Colletotrichum destructivum TaxID=34406 RepID=A0AAX4IE89_9PEZI|nr:hypothetical protein CDEST_06710 [Colletotrichum destructivum]